MKAKDIMSADVTTVTPEMEIARVAKLLLDRRVNGLPVVDKKGKLVGIICQSDLVSIQKKISMPSIFTLLDGLIPLVSSKHIEQEIKKIAAVTVQDAMVPNPVTVSPETGIEEIATLMVEKKFHTLPVMDSGKLVGVIGKEDVLKTLLKVES